MYNYVCIITPHTCTSANAYIDIYIYVYMYTFLHVCIINLGANPVTGSRAPSSTCMVIFDKGAGRDGSRGCACATNVGLESSGAKSQNGAL